MSARARTRVPRRRHDFVADERIPADHRARRYCRICGVAGEVGDRRHPVRVLPPVPRSARQLDARILGEAGDE